MLDRRQFAGIAAAGGLAALTGRVQAMARSRVPAVHVEAPPAGAKGRIFGAHAEDLAAQGYVEEEYFVSGTATSYAPVGALGPDGVWTVAPDRQAPFRTRVIVQRPADPAAFNGTIICEWANVSAGFEISSAVNQQFWKDGYAYAAISAQRMGLEGTKERPLGLRQWDAERYGSLSIAGDSFSYDIFSQVARALGPARGGGGVDPMGGLSVRRLFALGESQSAARLLSYVNAVHRLANVFDTYMIVVAVGRSTEFDDFVYDPAKSLDENNNIRRSRTVQTRVRTDQRVPVLVLNSETETPYFFASRQPDSDWYRLWEVAGSTHASAIGGGRRPDISARDGVPDMAARWAKMVDLFPVMEAAAAGLDRWLSGGAPLGSFERIAVAGERNAPATDGFGNAKGGVRLPEIMVPAARFVTQTNDASGRLEPFDAATLWAIYKDDADYAARIRAAAEWAEAAGLILPRRRDEYIAKSARGPVPFY
ncbi:MAG TPA: alpha/beta hydrolase domain-containing protein [Sphingopyxis sp.]|nr:alpha/beta hydrolase domain-containing protein [Sphingopyxis sp.]HMQ18026.1 alpha/beta hydrolase domain-containing protein [Sphingopyxis sp.]